METQERPDQDMLDRLHQDPDNWKWGIFYYNKKSPGFSMGILFLLFSW